MSKKITDAQVHILASNAGWDYPVLRAIIEVESGGIGFAKDTGKIIIQFEPAWFRKKEPYTPSGKWSVNGVERQSQEWIAFNEAFRINANAAMESTSVGMMQVMGFHYKTLGFNNVGEMWDFAKESEANQVELAIRFIKSNPKLDTAVKNKDFPTIAYYYNGSGYKKYNYDQKLLAAWKKYK